MSRISDKLEKQADVLFNNIAGWETNALRRIGRRVKEIKSLSYADLQAINNATIVKQDVNAILDELAVLTGQNAKEVKRIYSDMIEQQHEENRVLYDYRNKPFIPFADNKELQAIVMAYARTTAETMVNLSMTKARQLGTVDINGKFIPIEKSFKDVLDKAVMSVATGTGDFGSEMRGVLKELGGSGLRVDYGGGVTRRLDTMVRQNLLWGAKQASIEYNDMIGEELGCDGIEIDWHSNPRPSHEFMQGKQYSLHGEKTINGVTYESAEKALEALQDYGCLHFKTPIILGVSEPTYSPEELKRLNEQNKRTFEIDGKQMTGYECKQGMRRLETEAKKTKEQMEILKASGDSVGVSQLKERLGAIEDKYNQIAKASGIKPQPQRMAIVKAPKNVDISAESGIINKYKGKGLSVHSNASVSDEVRQKVEDATKRITSDFKALEKYSEPITFGDADGGLAINKFSALTGKNEIILEEKEFSNPDDLLQKLKEDYKAKLSYDTNNIESLVAHEMGHNAHIALALKRSGLQYGNQLNHIQRTILNKEYGAISQEIYSICFSDESLEEIQKICAKELGTSVMGNPHELIAQAFGNYYYGTKRSWLAEKVVNYFMKGLK